jgi:hypothetical protein
MRLPQDPFERVHCFLAKTQCGLAGDIQVHARGVDKLVQLDSAECGFL